jgi:hypothetical protein
MPSSALPTSVVAVAPEMKFSIENMPIPSPTESNEQIHVYALPSQTIFDCSIWTLIVFNFKNSPVILLSSPIFLTHEPHERNSLKCKKNYRVMRLRIIW